MDVRVYNGVVSGCIVSPAIMDNYILNVWEYGVYSLGAHPC